MTDTLATALATPSWSAQQRAALDAIETWLTKGASKARSPFYLAGHAGTGKTTLAREIGQRAGDTVFAAFTGKAASVMRRKGCVNASTIDSLIYMPQLESFCVATPPCIAIQACPHLRDENRCPHLREHFIGRILNEHSAAAAADLIVIDEVSMVGAQMGAHLLSFGRPLLVLGDPGQLPPIKDAGFFTSRTPDFQLTQVHRQAMGSPVIQLATLAREGRALPQGQHVDSRVLAGSKALSVDDMRTHPGRPRLGPHHSHYQRNFPRTRKWGKWIVGIVGVCRR
jgi:exodeoxyribonuclease-5